MPTPQQVELKRACLAVAADDNGQIDVPKLIQVLENAVGVVTTDHLTLERLVLDRRTGQRTYVVRRVN